MTLIEVQNPQIFRRLRPLGHLPRLPVEVSSEFHPTEELHLLVPCMAAPEAKFDHPEERQKLNGFEHSRPCRRRKNVIERRVRTSFRKSGKHHTEVEIKSTTRSSSKSGRIFILFEARYLIPRKSRVGASEHELELNSAESNDNLRKFGLME